MKGPNVKRATEALQTKEKAPTVAPVEARRIDASAHRRTGARCSATRSLRPAGRWTPSPVGPLPGSLSRPGRHGPPCR